MAIALRAMPLGPLGVTAVLAALDWGAWDWATNNNQTTVGLIAGLLGDFTGRRFDVREIDCWATGGRMCRFRAVAVDA